MDVTALPDITALGPWTYLATEVVFGSLALALLVYAGALRRAARTVVALYPLAYVWDWYTLEVGVFAIETRTGVDLLGIPIEEHLFIVVVPALVIGFHETIHGRILADAPEEGSPVAEDGSPAGEEETPAGDDGSDPGEDGSDPGEDGSDPGEDGSPYGAGEEGSPAEVPEER